MSLGNSPVSIVASGRTAAAMIRATEETVCELSGSNMQQALSRAALAVAVQLAVAGTAIDNSTLAGEVAHNG